MTASLVALIEILVPALVMAVGMGVTAAVVSTVYLVRRRRQARDSFC